MSRAHRHRLEAVAVQPGPAKPAVLFAPAPAPATIVLYHCSGCHHTETTTLTGTWTLGQVRGEQDLTALAPFPERAGA